MNNEKHTEKDNLSSVVYKNDKLTLYKGDACESATFHKEFADLI